MPEFLLLGLLGIVLLGLRLFAGGLDRGRVKEYAESRGGTLIESSWTPFGRGFALAAENQRLRAELDRLKRDQG